MFGFEDHKRRTYAGSGRIQESKLIRWVILLRQPGDDISLCWTKLHYFDGLKWSRRNEAWKVKYLRLTLLWIQDARKQPFRLALHLKCTDIQTIITAAPNYEQIPHLAQLRLESLSPFVNDYIAPWSFLWARIFTWSDSNMTRTVTLANEPYYSKRKKCNQSKRIVAKHGSRRFTEKWVFVYNHIELESIASMSADYYLPSSQGDLDYESNEEQS
jgi:hypothetical protein